MTTKGTAYAAGKDGRLYVALDDRPIDGRPIRSFVQLRTEGEPEGSQLYREYGPVRMLALARAVLLVGQRFELVGEGYWRRVQ